MRAMFELLEHTADVGFRVRGRALEELFAAAGEALQAIAFDTAAVEPRERYALSASGEDLESLLVNWLSEVLYWMDGRRVLIGRFEILELTPERIAAEGWGEPWDPARHPARTGVKAVTYHQLRVAREGEGWVAEVYLDI
jgi:SHS2 domain-containing protein